MKRLLIWLVLVAVATPVWAGHNNRPHSQAVRMTVGEAIAQGLVDESARYKWKSVPYFTGGIDSRIGGTKQPVGGGGIRDMRTDLWGAGDGGELILNPYTDVSGYGTYLTRVDRYGDSLSIYRHCYEAKTGHTTPLVGIACGERSAGWVQVACSNYERIATPRVAGTLDLAGTGGAVREWLIDSTTVETADSIIITDEYYWHAATAVEGDSCKLLVHRRLAAHKADPYFLVRYSVKSVDMDNEQGVTGDTLRFIWTDSMTLGQDGVSADHRARVLGTSADIGYQWGYGEVRMEHLFDNPEYPVACEINIGNLLAPLDTSMAGDLIRTDLADSLWLDQGSGIPQTLGMFVAINPNGTPAEKIFYGTGFVADPAHFEAWAALAYDSTLIAQHEDAEAFNYDSTTVIGSTTGRGFNIISESVVVDTANFTVWEWAVGTVRFSDQTTPYWSAIPKIRFTDGTVLAIPYYRKR